MYERRDLNPRPHAPKAWILPAEILSYESRVMNDKALLCKLLFHLSYPGLRQEWDLNPRPIYPEEILTYGTYCIT